MTTPDADALKASNTFSDTLDTMAAGVSPSRGQRDIVPYTLPPGFETHLVAAANLVRSQASRIVELEVECERLEHSVAALLEAKDADGSRIQHLEGDASAFDVTEVARLRAQVAELEAWKTLVIGDALDHLSPGEHPDD